MTVLINGQFVPAEQALVPVTDRSFLYGDGVFETIPVYNGKPFRWAQHLERLTRGADFLKIRLAFAPKELRVLAGQLIERNQMPNAVLRLTLSRGAGERGYSPKGAEAPLVVMTLDPMQPVDPQNPPHWRLQTSSYKLPASDPLSSFKTNNKLLQVLARAEAEAADADDALLLNTNGEVAETSSANLFWIYRDTVYTTPTGRGALPGITRAVVLELCQALNLPSNKRVIKPESLRKSDGIFLSLSSLGIVPVCAIDGEPVPTSTVVDKILATYHEVVQRETAP
ncbi:MAG TPA: aminotransferase class IV [Haliangiales bacterium]|nr:aminotransferase class IV [Haliangiales bacterium]